MPSFDARTLRMLGLDTSVGVLVSVVYVEFARFGSADGAPFFTGPAWLGWVIAGAVGLPLAVRRLRPLTVLAVVLCGLTAATLWHITREPYLAAALALYLVGLRTPLRRAVAALVVAGVVAAVGLVVAGEAGLVALVWLVLGAGWAGGYVMRRLRSRAGRAAEAAIDQVRAEERMVIAREVHDIMSHHMTLIAVQAGVANHVADQHPEETREALRIIEAISRGALDEMRSMLGVLRSSPSTLDPTPGLDELEGLVTRALAGGVTVDLGVAVSAEPPRGVQLAAYRIVQEALTNVVKHAAPANCTVRIDAGWCNVDIEVISDGPMWQVMPHGHGLVGMGERAALYGGELEAGPRDGGGFAVSARLPYFRTGVAT